MKLKKTYIWLISVVFILGFFLRFYNLSHIPPGLHGDEAEFGIRQQHVMKMKNIKIFTLEDPYSLFNYSVLSYWAQGVFQKIFGENTFGIRASSAFIGSVTVLAFFFMTRLFFKDRLVSLLLMLSLTTSHWHIAYSRMALNNIWTTFFTVVSFGLLYKGFLTHRRIFFLSAGVVGGLSLYFAQANRVIPIILITWCTIYLLFYKNKKNFRIPFVNSLLLFASICIVFSPIALYYVNTPGTFNSRIDTVSIFNHLPEYFIRYKVQNTLGVLFWQSVNTLKVFPLGGDIGYYFYAYQGGLLTPIICVFSIIGMLLSFARIRQEKYLLMITWFLIVIFLGGTLTIDAPSSQRLLAVIPVLFLFAGVAVAKILQLKRAYLKLFLIVIIILNSFWDYKIYFIDYVHSQAGWAQREPATQIAYYLQALGPSWKVYMLREEAWFYFKHGTIKFINPTTQGEDIEVSSTVIPLKEIVNKNIVYIMPFNSPSLGMLKAAYPKGHERYFLNPNGNTPSFASYEVKHQYLLPKTIKP